MLQIQRVCQRERERRTPLAFFKREREREIVRDTLSERGTEIHTFIERGRERLFRERERESPLPPHRDLASGEGAHPCYPSQREREWWRKRERERELSSTPLTFITF